jgi:hypothetical protein
VKKKVTIDQYDKIMQRIVDLEGLVSVQDRLIMMLEEAAKYIIVDQNVMIPYKVANKKKCRVTNKEE